MSKPPASARTGKNKPVQSTASPLSVTSPPQRFLTSPLVHLLLLALVALIAYANTFHVPFVFDDESSIVDNPVIKDLAAFLSGAGYAYNPRRFIGYLSFALNYRLGGLNVTGYHAVNLTIHILNGWLVYWLVRLTLKTPFFKNSSPLTPHSSFIALCAALLFVAHPVQTQAVTYIVQRLASLATLFYLAALACYAKGRLSTQVKPAVAPFTIHRSPFIFFALSLVFAILAMRTKEIAATLPLVVVLYEFSFFRTDTRKKLLFLIPILLTILIIPLGMLHTGKPLGELLSDVSEMTRQSQTISRGNYLLTQFAVIVTYIRLLLFPAGQNLDYDYPVYDSLFTPRVLSSFFFLLALLGMAVWLYRRSSATGHRSPVTAFQRLIAFGILWFFITLSVESSVIPIADLIFEHRLYLPSVGAFISLAALAVMLFQRYSPRTMATASAVVVIILIVVTWQRNLVWGDPISLWNDAAAKSQKKYRPHNNLGNAFNARGRFDEAIEQLLLALKVRPNSAEARNNLGSAYERQGSSDKAVTEYLEAVRLKPDYVDAYYNLGAVYQKQGKNQAAFDLYQKVLSLKPRHMNAHNNLGALYNKEGLPDKAIGEFLTAIRLNPDFVDAYVNLGEAYLKKGQIENAVEQMRSALARNPDNARAYFNLGVVADLMGDLDKAIEQYETALKLDSAFPEAASNLGIDYGSKGLTDRAIAQFQAAIRQKPNDADFHYNLAKAYALKGWSEKAAEENRLAVGLEKRENSSN